MVIGGRFASRSSVLSRLAGVLWLSQCNVASKNPGTCRPYTVGLLLYRPAVDQLAQCWRSYDNVPSVSGRPIHFLIYTLLASHFTLIFQPILYVSSVRIPTPEFIIFIAYMTFNSPSFVTFSFFALFLSKVAFCQLLY